MDRLLYFTARAAINFLQMLPLGIVARIGRFGGMMFYFLDARHRRVARKNLRLCFSREKSENEINQIARESFRRIGENFSCAVKTAAMSPEQLRKHLTAVGVEKMIPFQENGTPQSRIVAIGHFGNFELYARFGQFVKGFQNATTYRGLRQPSLNRLMQSLRERADCRFFERRTDAAALKAAMSEPGLLLGLLADQHAGNNGLRLPFFGHDCSTSAAPALFALRYHCPLNTGFCFRLGLAKWQLEAGDEIPTHENGEPRSTSAIMSDVNRAFEAAIRRDPANWFWVHNRWKPGKWKNRAALETKGESDF